MTLFSVYYNHRDEGTTERPPGKSTPITKTTTAVDNKNSGGKHMSMNELESKVSQLRELRRMADELAGEIAATEDALKAYMTANGPDELYGCILYTSTSTREQAGWRLGDAA